MASSSTTSPPPASPKAPVPASPAVSASAGPSKPSSETPRPILETTWHALSQAPPPPLREILSAYNAKGEGDREMLIALLNAKSAEDQRLAALATLHQTVLQMQHAIAIAAVTAQSPQARAPPVQAAAPPAPPTQQPAQLHPASASRRKRSHAEYAPDAYRHAYDEREPTLPLSPESSSSSPPRAEFPHLSNPSTMSIRTLLHPSKRRRESAYDERYDDRHDERVYEERDREREHREREYRVRDAPRRPHVVVHPPAIERDSHRYAVRTSSARDEAADVGRSP